MSWPAAPGSVSWVLRLVSRISVRLLAFNLLLVFLPVAGIYYLDVYERQLLDAQERAMVQEGRILAAVLSERGPLQPREAEGLLTRLRQRSEARLRVVDLEGRVLADSSRLGPRLEDDAAEARSRPARVRDEPLYRAGAWLYRQYDRVFGATPPAEPEAAEASAADVSWAPRRSGRRSRAGTARARERRRAGAGR